MRRSHLHCKGATSCFFGKHFGLRAEAALRLTVSERRPFLWGVHRTPEAAITHTGVTPRQVAAICHTPSLYVEIRILHRKGMLIALLVHIRSHIVEEEIRKIRAEGG